MRGTSALGRIALLLALSTLGSAALAASSPAAPPLLWERCVGAAADDVSCRIPRGVASDPNDGTVYVTDQANRRIVVFSPWGSIERAWGWDVVESGPGDDTTAPEDQFEICVPANGDVCKAGVQGSGSGQFGSIPQGVAVDSSGAVYVVDFSNRRVQKFDSEGNFVLMFGGQVNKTKVEEAAPAAQQNRCTAASGDVC
ncbi:MAG TPA: hypothetical protein VFT19_05330, partial [Solirubrobacterales bacterium]|nr:hypothetical protein [Solirubrobacterales bacterium]